jgi:hypothetical protein
MPTASCSRVLQGPSRTPGLDSRLFAGSAPRHPHSTLNRVDIFFPASFSPTSLSNFSLRATFRRGFIRIRAPFTTFFSKSNRTSHQLTSISPRVSGNRPVITSFRWRFTTFRPPFNNFSQVSPVSAGRSAASGRCSHGTEGNSSPPGPLRAAGRSVFRTPRRAHHRRVTARRSGRAGMSPSHYRCNQCGSRLPAVFRRDRRRHNSAAVGTAFHVWHVLRLRVAPGRPSE